MRNNGRIIDAWMQHMTPSFIGHPMFESLQRWSHGRFGAAKDASGGDIPLDWTVKAMDQGGVRLGLCCAWWGPQGPMISNEQVAGFVQRYPDRLVGIASVNLYRPMEAVRE